MRETCFCVSFRLEKLKCTGSNDKEIVRQHSQKDLLE